jgi:hypothetical protein
VGCVWGGACAWQQQQVTRKAGVRDEGRLPTDLQPSCLATPGFTQQGHPLVHWVTGVERAGCASSPVTPPHARNSKVKRRDCRAARTSRPCITPYSASMMMWMGQHQQQERQQLRGWQMQDANGLIGCDGRGRGG